METEKATDAMDLPHEYLADKRQQASCVCGRIQKHGLHTRRELTERAAAGTDMLIVERGT